MLRTNSKKAAENIRAYIVDGFSPEGYTETGTLYAIIGRCSNLFILF